ncbi:MAG: glycerol-3-phosphate dehydrogenase/oxidase [Planctomycetaceae bacterium]
MLRSKMIERLSSSKEPFDLLIIGGGATGLGTAVEAASRGYRVALFERGDFASGTSSRSTKLIHGGVRYLKQGQIGMVRYSLLERERLLKNAPTLVRPLSFVLPAYRIGERAVNFVGLRLYDALAGQRSMGSSRWLSRSQVLELMPSVQSTSLRGGVLYHDAQFDDARLAVALAMTAVRHNAAILNYAPVANLIYEGSAVTGAEIRDLQTGELHRVTARRVLNCTGVFAETLLEADRRVSGEHEGSVRIAPSRGTHIVTDAEFLPGNRALMIPSTDDGRVLFAIPWLGKVLIGTTDRAVNDVTTEPVPEEDEIRYLLDHLRRYLSRCPGRSDIRSVFSGLRPLVRKSQSKSTAALSREHSILTSRSGLVTVIGGKWTTYRQMGEELVDLVERTSGWHHRPSVTGDLSIEIPESRSVKADLNKRQTVGELSNEEQDFVRYCVRHEMAESVEDVLARRSRLLFLDATVAAGLASSVAAVMSQELGKPSDWATHQTDQFLRFASCFAANP